MITLLTPSFLKAQDSLNVSYISSLYNIQYGNFSRITVAGDYAYATNDEGKLIILNISNPGIPYAIRYYDLPAVAVDIALMDSSLYITGGAEGIWIIDVREPENPREIGRFDEINAEKIIIEGQLAYVTNRDSLYVLDVSEPEEVEQICRYESPLPIRDIALSGSYAVLGAGFNGFFIVDLSNLYEPVAVAFNETRTSHVQVSGNYAYIVSNQFDGCEISIFDIINPVDPQLLGSYNIIAAYDEQLFINALGINERFAYLPFTSEDLWAPTAYGMFVILISDPRDPQMVETVDLTAPCSEIITNEFNAFLANESSLRIFDLSNPGLPTEAGCFPGFQPDKIRSIQVDGEFTYLASENGLFVVDISDPSVPVNIPVNIEGGPYTDIVINRDYAFLSVDMADSITNRSCLEILDISDPYNLEIASVSHNISTDGWRVAVSDQYVYVVGCTVEDTGLFIYDFDRLITFFAVDGYLENIKVAGDLVFIASGEMGLQIINVSDPYNPVRVGVSDYHDSVSDVFVDSNFAYLANGEEGFCIVDISAPPSPEVICTYNTPGTAVSIDAWYNYIFVSDYSGGIRIYDISYPENPEEVGFHTGVSGFPLDLDVEYPYAYVITDNTFEVFNFNVTTEAAEMLSSEIPSAFLIKSLYPNPFNSLQTVVIGLPQSSQLKVSVFNPLGQEIVVLTDGFKKAGIHSLTFDGSKYSSGIYFINAIAPGNLNEIRKVVLIK